MTHALELVDRGARRHSRARALRPAGQLRIPGARTEPHGRAHRAALRRARGLYWAGPGRCPSGVAVWSSPYCPLEEGTGPVKHVIRALRPRRAGARGRGLGGRRKPSPRSSSRRCPTPSTGSPGTSAGAGRLARAGSPRRTSTPVRSSTADAPVRALRASRRRPGRPAARARARRRPWAGRSCSRPPPSTRSSDWPARRRPTAPRCRARPWPRRRPRRRRGRRRSAGDKSGRGPSRAWWSPRPDSDADCDQARAGRLQGTADALQLTELAAAEGSPEAAVEDEHGGAVGQQRRERGGPARRVRQRESAAVAVTTPGPRVGRCRYTPWMTTAAKTVATTRATTSTRRRGKRRPEVIGAAQRSRQSAAQRGHEPGKRRGAARIYLHQKCNNNVSGPLLVRNCVTQSSQSCRCLRRASCPAAWSCSGAARAVATVPRWGLPTGWPPGAATARWSPGAIPGAAGQGTPGRPLPIPRWKRRRTQAPGAPSFTCTTGDAGTRAATL